MSKYLAAAGRHLRGRDAHRGRPGVRPARAHHPGHRRRRRRLHGRRRRQVRRPRPQGAQRRPEPAGRRQGQGPGDPGLGQRAGPRRELPDGTPVAKARRFASTTDYQLVNPGTWTLQLQPKPARRRPPRSAPTWPAGSVYSLLVLDGANGLTLELRADARGGATAPDGGVETGAGGEPAPWLDRRSGSRPFVMVAPGWSWSACCWRGSRGCGRWPAGGRDRTNSASSGSRACRGRRRHRASRRPTAPAEPTGLRPPRRPRVPRPVRAPADRPSAGARAGLAARGAAAGSSCSRGPAPLVAGGRAASSVFGGPWPRRPHGPWPGSPVTTGAAGATDRTPASAGGTCVLATPCARPRARVGPPTRVRIPAHQRGQPLEDAGTGRAPPAGAAEGLRAGRLVARRRAPGDPGRRSSPATWTRVRGPAVFYRAARRCAPATPSRSTAAGRLVTFRVTAVEQYPKNAVPDRQGLPADPGPGAAADHLRRGLRRRTVCPIGTTSWSTRSWPDRSVGVLVASVDAGRTALSSALVDHAQRLKSPCGTTKLGRSKLSTGPVAVLGVTDLHGGGEPADLHTGSVVCCCAYSCASCIE